MKKLCSIFLALLMMFPAGLLGMIFTNATAMPTIAVGNVSGFADSIVEVPVEISDNPGITALSFDISYDSTKINLLNVIDGEILGTSTATFGNDLSSVPYTLCWDDLSTESNKGNGTVAILRFRILSGATGNAEIEIKLNQSSTFNVELEDVEFTTVNGAINITPVSVSEVLIQSYPIKTSYFIGDILDIDGLILVAIYSNGSIETITDGFTTSGFDSSIVGTQQITITYAGKTTSFNVTVSDVEVTSIAISKIPDKTDYYVGEKLDTTGLALEVNYSNGTTENVIGGYTCTPTILGTSGTQEITVEYCGMTTSFYVTVSDIEVTSISASKLPNKTDYYVGEMLDTTGLELTVNYNNGTTETVSGGYTCTPTVLNAVGTQQVTVEYLGKATSFSVMVNETATEVIFGDVNNDGVVNTLDRVILTRYIANWAEYPEESINMLAADVNCDGNVNTLDRTILTRHIANWDGYIELPYCVAKANGYVSELKQETVAVNGEISGINGDANDDYFVDISDVLIIRRWLSGGWGAVINEVNADVNNDNSIDLKDVVILRRYLSDEWDIDLDSFKTTEPEPEPGSGQMEQFVYGKSENGRDLVCYSFTPENYKRTILLNFAIHGFEDDYAHDGQVLVNAANELIEYYKTYELGDCRVLIVPCANPDGVYDGITNNGFGRCNALGIDLNRDFDANYVANPTAGRNYTPYAFSGAESRALRDLCYEYNPDVVCDFHGWLNTTIGDPELAEVFLQEMGLAHQVGFTSTNCRGYFANWAHQQGALGLLVEFKNTQFSVESLKNAVNRLISGDYDNGQDKYELDSRFSKFSGGIDCYTLSTGRTTTYQDVNVAFDTPSYIDGATDLCTVQKIYDNGWVKVSYPLVSGGNKTAYCKLSDFIIEGTEVMHYTSTVSANTKVYRRPDMSETTGSVWTTDTFTVVAEYENKLQIIYPLDSGGWKMGWISK